MTCPICGAPCRHSTGPIKDTVYVSGRWDDHEDLTYGCGCKTRLSRYASLPSCQEEVYASCTDGRPLHPPRVRAEQSDEAAAARLAGALAMADPSRLRVTVQSAGRVWDFEVMSASPGPGGILVIGATGIAYTADDGAPVPA